MTCLASIFMTLHYCAYIIINQGLFGHLKYAYRTVMLFILFLFYFLQFLLPSLLLKRQIFNIKENFFPDK